jgi:H+/gluconate symporter-like permease
MFEVIGLLFSLALLITLALKGVNIITSSIICSLVVILTNGLSIAQGLSEYYPFGSLGAFTFAGKFYLLFACGAIFGRTIGESHAASAIALKLLDVLGKERVLWITVITTALLTYGGVVVFVVIFAMYPLGLKLLQETDIPKRLFCAAMALGAGTFTMSALPGSPSIHNVISAEALGTDLFAGAWLGILASVFMLVVGMWYLERQRKNAAEQGEGFYPAPTDPMPTESEHTDYPYWGIAVIPIAVVLLCITVPRLCAFALGETLIDAHGWYYDIIRFAGKQPIIWSSVSLAVGAIVAIILLPVLRAKINFVVSQGMQDSILPLVNTAAVIGFGSVVSHTEAFGAFTQVFVGLDIPPLMSVFGSVSAMSAIVGSASGGLQIFMQTLAPTYLEMGIEPEVLHRVATIASGGFDSMPHCGAIVAMLTIAGLSHREAYWNTAVVSGLVPAGAAIFVILISSFI